MSDESDYVPIVQPFPEKQTLRVVPPLCPKCNVPCGKFKWVTRPTEGSGSFFLAISWLCPKCKGWVKTPQDELDLLNQYTKFGNAWNAVYWPKGHLEQVKYDLSGKYG